MSEVPYLKVYDHLDKYDTGFDIPDSMQQCGTNMNKNGLNIPFAIIPLDLDLVIRSQISISTCRWISAYRP